MNESIAIQACRAVVAYTAALASCANDPERMASFCTAQGDDLDALYERMLALAMEALK